MSFEVQTEQPYTVQVQGSFATTTGAAVDPTTTAGRGYTVTKEGVGIYRIAFSNSYSSLVACQVSLQKSGGTLDEQATLGDIVAATRDTGATVDVYTGTLASPPVLIDPADDANSQIHFCAHFKRMASV